MLYIEESARGRSSGPARTSSLGSAGLHVNLLSPRLISVRILNHSGNRNPGTFRVHRLSVQLISNDIDERWTRQCVVIGFPQIQRLRQRKSEYDEFMEHPMKKRTILSLLDFSQVDKSLSFFFNHENCTLNLLSNTNHHNYYLEKKINEKEETKKIKAVFFPLAFSFSLSRDSLDCSS